MFFFSFSASSELPKSNAPDWSKAKEEVTTHSLAVLPSCLWIGETSCLSLSFPSLG